MFDLFPLDNLGDFFPTHSSLSSMSLESEQLQLSVYEIMGFTHTSSACATRILNIVGKLDQSCNVATGQLPRQERVSEPKSELGGLEQHL